MLLGSGSPVGFDESDKLVEESFVVIGAGSGFGVVLHREDGVFRASHTFNGVVVQVHVSDFHIIRERFIICGKAVILRGDGDFSGPEILNGVISATMTKLKFISRTSIAMSEDLVTETNTEDGHFADQLLHFVVNVGEGGRVSGAIREEDPIGVFRKNSGGHWEWSKGVIRRSRDNLLRSRLPSRSRFLP